MDVNSLVNQMLRVLEEVLNCIKDTTSSYLTTSNTKQILSRLKQGLKTVTSLLLLFILLLSLILVVLGSMVLLCTLIASSIILSLITLILILTAIITAYLSIIGYETDKFNSFLENKITSNFSNTKIDLTVLLLNILRQAF